MKVEEVKAFVNKHFDIQKNRDIILAHYEDGLNGPEIAEKYNVKSTYVNSTLYRFYKLKKKDQQLKEMSTEPTQPKQYMWPEENYRFTPKDQEAHIDVQYQFNVESLEINENDKSQRYPSKSN